MERLGFSENATRTALSRMLTGGDLLKVAGEYTLSERLLERQAKVDAAHRPEIRAWTGTWEMAVITSVGRSASDRTALRTQLQTMRVAELREGVWTRPANLRREWPQELLDVSRCFEARPRDDAAELAAELWDLKGWAKVGHELLAHLPATEHSAADRFTLIAAMVRHLQSDPLLPVELEPADWPGAQLRGAYDDYRPILENEPR